MPVASTNGAKLSCFRWFDAIEGKILARIFGVEQNFDFKLEGPRTRVGRIVVTPAK